jgi:hypothetical protein
MTKYNLKRINLYVPQYDTNAIITVEERNGQPHLVTTYDKIPPHGHEEVAAAIPADWTDKDLAKLITLSLAPNKDRNWPAWEIPAADFASAWLFRFWKGEKPSKQ